MFPDYSILWLRPARRRSALGNGLLGTLLRVRSRNEAVPLCSWPPLWSGPACLLGRGKPALPRRGLPAGENHRKRDAPLPLSREGVDAEVMPNYKSKLSPADDIKPACRTRVYRVCTSTNMSVVVSSCESADKESSLRAWAPCFAPACAVAMSRSTRR